MRATLTMTLNDLRIFFSQRGNWLSLALLPILFTVGLGFAFGGDSGPETLRVDVIDEDGSAASRHLLNELVAANTTLLLCPPVNDNPAGDAPASDESARKENEGDDPCELEGEPLTLAVAQERVREGDSNALVVIPAGYGDALISMTSSMTPSVTPTRARIDYYSTTPPTAPDPVRQSLDAVLLRVNSAALTATVADEVLARVGEQSGFAAIIDPWRAGFVSDIYTKTEMILAQRPPAVAYVEVGSTPRNGTVQGFSQSVPGVGSMYVMFTVLGGMVLIQRERQRWTLQRLGVFPITRGQILGGKILTYFILGMLQYLIVFGVGLAVGLDFGPNPWLVLPTMAAFVLCCTALTFAIGPLLHSEGQANVMVQLLALTFASLGGAWWPLEIVPEFMQRIGHLTPVAWVMDAFRDLIYFGGGFADIVPELSVLLVAAAVLFGVGIWRFRYL